VDVEAAARVLEPCHHDLLVDDADGFELLLALREDGHGFASAVGHVHRHQAPERRVLVRHEEEPPVGVPDVRVGVGEALEQEGRLAVALAVGDPDLALVARAFVARDDQVPSVEGQVRAPDDLLLGRVLEDERVLVLGIAQPVEVDLREVVLVAGGHRSRLREARVVEAGLVRRPDDGGELRQDLVRKVLARGDVADVDLLPIAPAPREAVSEQGAVLGGRRPRESDGAVGAERVGVEQDALLALEAFADVEHGLVLEAGVPREEVPRALFLGDGHPREIQQLGEARLDRVAPRAVEVRARERVLGLDPFHRLRVRRVLEPAVRIGDLDRAVILDDGALLRRRIRRFRGTDSAADTGDDQAEQEGAHEAAPQEG
jgi:hypothetical protein